MISITVALDYEFFRPTERAILTLVSPTYLKSNLDALKNLTISGIPVSSDSYVAEVQQERQRMRGHEGRLKAARRGALTGHGPNAGIVNNALTVTIAGLPARMTVDDLAYFLKDFDVAESGKGLPQILKLPLWVVGVPNLCRFVLTSLQTTENFFDDFEVSCDTNLNSRGSPSCAKVTRFIHRCIRRRQSNIGQDNPLVYPSCSQSPIIIYHRAIYTAS